MVPMLLSSLSAWVSCYRKAAMLGMPHSPAPHPLELSGLLTALLTLHHTLQQSHAPLHSGMGSRWHPPSFVHLPFTSVKKMSQFGMLVTCGMWLSAMRPCTCLKRAKLIAPINAFLFEAANVSQWMGLSLFPLAALRLRLWSLLDVRKPCWRQQLQLLGLEKGSSLHPPVAIVQTGVAKYLNPESDARV